MSDKMIHVQIENPTQEGAEHIRELLKDEFESQVVVSDSDMSIGEVPALDDFADELAERVADKMGE